MSDEILLTIGTLGSLIVGAWLAASHYGRQLKLAEQKLAQQQAELEKCGEVLAGLHVETWRLHDKIMSGGYESLVEAGFYARLRSVVYKQLFKLGIDITKEV